LGLEEGGHRRGAEELSVRLNADALAVGDEGVRVLVGHVGQAARVSGGLSEDGARENGEDGAREGCGEGAVAVWGGAVERRGMCGA